MGLVSNKALYDNKLQLIKRVLRLRGRVGQRRTGSTDRDGSDPPVRGPGTGSGAGVFAHLPPPSWGRSRAIDPSRKGVGPMRPATLAIIGTALGAAAIYAVARAAGLTDLGLRVDLAEGDWERTRRPGGRRADEIGPNVRAHLAVRPSRPCQPPGGRRPRRSAGTGATLRPWRSKAARPSSRPRSGRGTRPPSR